MNADDEFAAMVAPVPVVAGWFLDEFACALISPSGIRVELELCSTTAEMLVTTIITTLPAREVAGFIRSLDSVLDAAGETIQQQAANYAQERRR